MNARSAQPLPEVPALAASMERLRKRCEEAAARMTGHPVDVKLQNAGALKSGETVDLGTGEILEIQTKAPTDSGETEVQASSSLAAPTVTPRTSPPLEWTLPKRNADGSATIVTTNGRYAVLRTPPEPPFRYAIFHIENGLRYVLGSRDSKDEAVRICEEHARAQT